MVEAGQTEWKALTGDLDVHRPHIVRRLAYGLLLLTARLCRGCLPGNPAEYHQRPTDSDERLEPYA
jgi:hypothetical protein